MRLNLKLMTSMVCGLGLGMLGSACDLPSKDLGVEDTEGSGSGGATSGGETGGMCQPGDVKDAPDGCNTCGCTEDGEWVCTAIGCVDTDDAPSEPPTPCEPGQVWPDPDGCNECVCQDDGETWACTLLACETDGSTTGEPPGEDPFQNNGIHVCGPDVPNDGVFINAAAVVGNELNVSMEYGGGCEMHLTGLCWDGAFQESDPVQVQAFIAHESNDDPCEALLSEERTFDLASLAEAWIEGYQTDHGTIIIHLEGWQEPLEYVF